MLEDLLAPITQEEFFAEYWTKRFVHVPGPPDKHARFFSWDVLSRTLEGHRFVPPRLDLVKSGQTLEPERYLNGDRVSAHALMNELAQGATLILNFCEEVHPPLRELCVELERRFHVYVQVNLYAGWRADNGFNIHWDDQDTLILQIAGRKHWRVWEPTRSHPFKRDIVDTSPKTKPEGPPIWDGILEQGGLLSMPRGWWHVAYPMDEPCMHLTVTIKNLNGIDLLLWFADQMKTSEAARKELPIVASEEEKREWLDAVWRDLATTWSSDLVERYVAHVDERAKPRPSLRLPELAGPTVTMVEKDTALELALPRPLHFQTSNGTTHFSAAGVDWKTTSNLVPALARFNDGRPHTAREVDAAGGAALTALLTALVMKGVLRPAAQ